MSSPPPQRRPIQRYSTQPLIPFQTPYENENENAPQSPLELHDESGMEFPDTSPNNQNPALLAGQRQGIQSLHSIPHPSNPYRTTQPSLFAFQQDSIRGSRMVHITSDQRLPEPTRLASRTNIQANNDTVAIPIENIVEENQRQENATDHTDQGGQREEVVDLESSPQAQSPEEVRIKKAASLRLWLEFFFNICVLICYVLAFLFINKIIPANAVFGVALGFVLIFMIGPIRRKGLYAEFDKLDALFSVCHHLCLAAYVVACCLKYNGNNIPLTHVSLLGLIVLFLSCCKNSVDEPSPFKATLLMVKLFVWIQTILISIRIDGLPLPWGTIFIPAYFSLVILAFSSILIIFGALFAFFNIMREEGASVQLVLGSLWYILNALYTPIWLGIVTGVVVILDDGHDKRNLQLGLIVGFGHSGLLFLYTVIFWRVLHKFQEFEVRSETLVHDDDGQEEADYEENEQSSNIRFKVSKDNKTYLTSVSSTFYAYMGKHLKSNESNNNANAIIKKQIENAKMPKKRNALALNLPHHTDTPTPNNPNQQFSPPKQVKKQRNLDFSEGDIKISMAPSSLMMKQGESVHSNGDLCVVCYDHVPNGVFMDCGHGGICYECALDSWKKSDFCAFCRQRVNKILKIVNCKPLNITKVVESTTKVVERA